MPFSAELVHSNLRDFKYQLTWYKHSARNFLNAKKQPMRVCENIVIFAGRQSTYNPQMVQGQYAIRKSKEKRLGVYGAAGASVAEGSEYYPNDLLDFPSVKTSERVHPTQNPVDLLRYLICAYSNVGETVLDFTMGSGSTGVAAHAEGRNFVGIELDPQMYAVACREIEKAQSQVRMEDVIGMSMHKSEQTKLF
jgi:site-specific DNA-methyltransferase (adenine-specific)